MGGLAIGIGCGAAGIGALGMGCCIIVGALGIIGLGCGITGLVVGNPWGMGAIGCIGAPVISGAGGLPNVGPNVGTG